jgi:glycosyltransferase involved in cell wall biosynthesis
MPNQQSKIKILQVIDEAGIGGGQKHLYWLAKYLDKKIFELIVVCGGEGCLSRQLSVLGIDCISLPKRLGLSMFWKLRRAVKRVCPDIVHTHGTTAGVWGRLAAWKISRPYLVHSLHGIHYLNYPGSLRKFLGIISEKLLSRFTERIICVSESDQKQGLAYKLFSPKQAKVIHNGVETKDSVEESKVRQVKEELKLDGNQIVVGTVGRLKREKGHIYLLAAAYLLKESLPQARFVIVGDGPLKDFLLAQTSKLQLEERVLFVGAREDVAALIQTFDIFVLPSLWEAFGMVLIEAMSQAKPVIATKVGGIVEIVEDQVNGLLIPARDPNKLAESILFLSENPNKRTHLGRKARLRSEDFSLDRMITGYQWLYLSLAEGKL